MSALRRRIFGIYTPENSPPPSRDSSPAPHVSNGADKSLKLVPTSTLEHLKKRSTRVKGTKRRNAWVFGLGGVFGLVLAATFATPTGSLDRLADVAGLKDMHLEGLLDVLPVGFFKDLKAMQSSDKAAAVAYDSFSVGLKAQKEGVFAKHPVIMIPGVISTGLESWGTEEQSRQYFRKRVWGSFSMMRALVLDKASWKKHIMLDEQTGLDPPGIKVRATQGFDSSDFFIYSYWIWNKILENLAVIGYDPNNAFTAAYDWRMTYENYEKRDRYFTRLKHHIELAKKVQNEKVVLVSHSMGSQVLYYFFQWAEAEGYGNGGKQWVEEHVESWINISGCMLGAVKDIPALLSGEMRDTAQLNAVAVAGMERFLSRHERADLLRHMPGISSMLPIGGDAVWGNHTWAPDDLPGQNFTFGNFLKFPAPTNETESPGWLTVGESLQYLWKHTDPWFPKLIKNAYSLGVAHTKEEVEANQKIPRKWMNPLETRLPYAPSMKIYCFYGMGKPTERAYYYREDPDIRNKTSAHIDTLQNTPDGFVDHGVVMGEGDGTVNLMSSGYMCNRGWRIKRYNPANITVIPYEMPHEPDRYDPRGGPNTGEHVDILGRRELNDLILRVAGGKGDKIKERVVSNIKTYAARVKIYDEDEDPNAIAAALAEKAEAAHRKSEDFEESHPLGHEPDDNTVAESTAPSNSPATEEDVKEQSHAERLLDEL